MKPISNLFFVLCTCTGFAQTQNAGNIFLTVDTGKVIQSVHSSGGSVPIRDGIDFSSFPVGSIIEFDENNKPYLCNTKYSSTAVGAILIIKGGFHDFVKDGVVEVLVISGEEGIKKGDFLATSSEAGYLMKATETGAYFGVALNDLPPHSKTLMKVRLEHGYYVPRK